MTKWQAYLHLTRINRPIGIYLVLWPALWALWLASGGWPESWVLLVFILGAVMMRSAGCVINDFADRDFDGHVSRTCNRPLAIGAISVRETLGFFVLLCLTAFALVLTLNPLTVWLSLVAVALAALYPFMKRHTYWPQFFLGAAFAWAIPMAFAAVQNTVPWEAWPVYAATLIWSLIYDTAYAVSDKEDDLKIGIKSTAILFGERLVWMVGFFQLTMLVLLVWTGLLFELTWPYFLSLGIVSALFAYHLTRLKSLQPERAFKVFLQNHWIGLIILSGIIASQ